MTKQGNHVAVVTGAASPRGIGWATALQLAASGIAVAVCDLQAQGVEELANLIRQRGGRALALTADVSRRADVEALYQRTAHELGAPDILVANAGITQSVSFSEISEEEWDRMLTVNLKSAYLCCQAALPWMRQREGGRIVFVSSMVARDGGGFGACHYAAAKAGMLGLARCLAREVAKDNITVNSVTPGSIDTDILKGRSAERGGKDVEAYQRERIAKTPLGRLGSADDVAGAIHYFATRADFCTGAIIDVNGGRFMG
jgi:NAD(P)-dependent dehydrogenase (short-subunit alcohol dehydrogenase family)